LTQQSKAAETKARKNLEGIVSANVDIKKTGQEAAIFNLAGSKHLCVMINPSPGFRTGGK